MDVCRHCNLWKVSRPRGLCKRCYYTPGLKDCYPRRYKDRWGNGWVSASDDFNGAATPPAEPTRAFPGTPEKVTVLMERARLLQELWHPLDAEQDEAEACLILED